MENYPFYRFLSGALTHFYRAESSIINTYWAVTLQNEHNNIYLILISEFNAHLKQIKVILSTVKKYRNFFTSD